MSNAPKSSTHPLVVGAAAAVILVSGLGAAAIMGWLPSSSGHGADSNGQTPAAQVASAPVQAGTPAVVQASSAPVQAPIQHHSPAVHHAPVQTASNGPAICHECGVIESVNEIDTKGQGSGVGAVGGAVVGGLLGNQVGNGHGRQLATIAGAIGGAMAGNKIEGEVKATKSYDISVRLNDGSLRTFHQTSVPAWRSGDHVRVVDGSLRSDG